MKILRLNPKKNKAQAIVEFAIVLPLLLLLLYGLMEAGRFLFIIQSVNNATRQAARYGSTNGVGANGVPRYQDCAAIRAAAQKVDFLNAFDDGDITITYDHGTSPYTPFDTCTGNQDAGVGAVTGDRVTVSINGDFNAVVPKLVPFVSRTVANGNPIAATSSRTLLLTIEIQSGSGSGTKQATTTTITADDNDPSEIGQSVRVDVTVSGSSPAPTGTVDITGADVNCSITLSNGSGSCNVTFNAIAGSALPETRTLVATYVGDSNYNTSTASEGHTVNKASTTTLITADTPDPSAANGQVAVTVSVTSAWGTPSGTVSITGANTNCTVTLPSSNCNVTFTSNGSKTLTATYNGDAQHSASSDTEPHTVANINDTITTITSPASFTTQTPTLSVNVGGASPTGTVVFKEGSTTLCTIGNYPSSNSCTSSSLSAGSHNITATYTSNNGLNGSSASQTITVGGTVTTISAGTPSGGTVPITVTVTGSGTPTGTVAITGADTNCTITLSGGTGTCNVTFNSPVTNKTLTGTYSGDSTHAGSSGTTNVTVTVASNISCAISAYTLGSWSGAFNANPATVTNTGTTTINGWTLTWTFPNGQTVSQMYNANFTQSGSAVTATDKGYNATINPGGTADFSFQGTWNNTANNYPSDFKLNGTSCTPPPVACSTSAIILSKLKLVNGNMVLPINNTLPSALQIKDVTVTWYESKGALPNNPLIMQSASIGGVTFWTGNNGSGTLIITPSSPTYIPTGPSSMTFDYVLDQKRWDDESVTINLLTPGCEGVVLTKGPGAADHE